MESLLSGCEAKFITKLNDLYSFLDVRLLRMIKNVINTLHEATIAASVITFYIDLLHSVSPSSPPRESNMFLNFCISESSDYTIAREKKLIYFTPKNMLKRTTDRDARSLTINVAKVCCQNPKIDVMLKNLGTKAASSHLNGVQVAGGSNHLTPIIRRKIDRRLENN